MKSFLQQYSDEAYALMRIVTGLMFSFHGVQKIFGVLSDHVPPVGSQVWIGGLLELIGGIAVMIGLRTRIAAFLCSGMMAVAYVQFHWMLQTGANFFPAVNKGELALLYSVVFLLIACRGAGKWAVESD